MKAKEKKRRNKYQIGIRIVVIAGMIFLIVFSFGLELLFAGRSL